MNGAAGKMSRCFRYRPAAPSFYVRNTVFTSEIPEKHSFEKNKAVLWQIKIKHISVMRGKDQLFIISDAVQHNTKYSFFNITLNERKVFVTIIETAFSGNHGSKEQGYINAFCGTAGKNLTV